ncbi:MAG: M23 family metallopeptidase [Thermodesulfobacteriota bacterium]
MRKKRFTIVVMPQDHSKVRQLSVPAYLFKGLAALAALVVLALSFIVYDYGTLRFSSSEVADIKKENIEQKIQLQAFSSKVGTLEEQMAKLRQFDRKLRIIANLESPDSTERPYGVGGPTPEEDAATSLGNKRDILIQQMNSDLNQLDAEASTQERSFTELQEHLIKQSSRLASTPSIWPVRGWVASAFGYRISPFTGLRQKHEGIDIANRMGTPIIAPASGVVTRVKREAGFGRNITISHGRGIVTKYGHLSKILVKVGQRVKRGDTIAKMGSTGRSTGPHLHYTVVVNGVKVNPFNYILN